MKKKALVLAVCLAISAPAISVAKALPADIVGLNLGNIQTSSFVGQRFEGIIPILFSNSKEASKLSVRLAPKSIFQQIGAERLPILESLSFQVSTRNNKSVVIVRSSQAIEMPFLNFVLEVTGPQGVVFQDYTVLIDPPNYQSVRTTPVAALKTVSKIKKTSFFELSKTKSTRYKVSSGDTLSKIASALKTSQISLKRMVDVIHASNPKAFVNNDIDRLKRGVFLKIPSANKIKAFKFTLADKSVKPVVEPENKKLESESLNSLNNNLNEKSVVHHTVKKGDTLFAITKKFGQSGLSFTKRMSAIHKANPQAFSKNRINVLKVGATLTIPYLNLNSVVAEKTQPAPEKATVVSPKQEMEQQVASEPKNSEKEVVAPTKKASQAVPKNADEGAEFLASGVNSMAKTPVVNATEVKSIDKKFKAENKKNIEAIKNLEKRVRELRNSLEESKSQLFHLEQVLKTKDIEIKQKNRKIKALNIDVNELEAELFEDQTVVSSNENKILEQNNTQEKVSQESSEAVIKEFAPVVAEAERVEELEADYYLENEAVDSGSEVDMLALTPKVLLEKAEKQTYPDDKIVDFLKEMSLSNASAGFLVVLLVLGLMNYRRRLYSYVRVVPNKNHPKFYPAEKEEEETTNFVVEDLFKNVNADNKKHPEITTTTMVMESTDEFSGSILEECNDLISELSEELQVDRSVETETEEEWEEIEEICDRYIEKIKEEEITELLTDSDESEKKPEVSFEKMVEDLIENLDEEAKEKGFEGLGELQKLNFADKLVAAGPSANFKEIMGYK